MKAFGVQPPPQAAKPYLGSRGQKLRMTRLILLALLLTMLSVPPATAEEPDGCTPPSCDPTGQLPVRICSGAIVSGGGRCDSWGICIYSDDPTDAKCFLPCVPASCPESLPRTIQERLANGESPLPFAPVSKLYNLVTSLP